MPSALIKRSADLLYVGRTDAKVALDELSDIVLLQDVVDECGMPVPAGEKGTVVAVLGQGEAYMVEFGPERPSLATVEPAALRLLEA